MCGRYSVIKAQKELETFYHSDMPEGYRGPNYNAAPTQTLPVVTLNGLELMQWGLMPQWANKPSIAYSLINARAETIFEKPTYKKPIIISRCLVPATGYFEWKKSGSNKIPFYYTLKSQDLFSFAGLYLSRKNEDGSFQHTYTIITCEPNKLAAQVHDRMPVILAEDEQNEWLDPDMIEPERIKKFLDAFPEKNMDVVEVGAMVGNVKNNNPDVIEPVI